MTPPVDEVHKDAKTRTIANSSTSTGVSPIPHISALSRAQDRWQSSIMDNDVLDEFASYQRGKGLADTTIRNRESLLRTLQRSLDQSLLDLGLRDLRTYLGRRDVSAGTRRTIRGAMIAFYSFIEDEGIRDDNPTTRLAPVTTPKGEPRPFTPQQIDAMLDSGAYRRTRAMILLGYYQGFRVSSISRVHGHDIDLISGTIATISKGGKERRIPLHPTVAELTPTMPADTWWFPARGGREGHVSPASITNLITLAKKRAGIRDPRLTPHSLRHSFGTDLVEEGVDIRVVQELMMHESLSTTQIYTRVSERRKQEGIFALPNRKVPARSGRTAA